jgi:hypothetical protein
MALTKESIKNARRKFEPVQIEEWGGELLIRRLSLRDLSALQAKETTISTQVDMIVYSAVTDAGEPVFSDEDREFLANEDAAVIGKLCREINRINGFDQTLEQVEKN